MTSSHSRPLLLTVTAAGLIAVAAGATAQTLDLQAELVGATGGPTVPIELFGSTVDIDGDVLAIGAPGHDLAGNDAGAAIVFRRNGAAWDRDASLVAPQDAPTGTALRALTVDDGTVITCASQAEVDGQPLAGTCWVFSNDGSAWSIQQALAPSDPSPALEFGTTVDADGDVLVIGAPGDSDSGRFSGAAYVFVRQAGEWSFSTKLTAGDGAAFDRFGRAVAVSSAGAIAVGAPSEGDIGAAYLFEPDGGSWTQTAKIIPPTAADGDDAGTAVAFADAETLAIGMPFSDLAETDAGAVAVYRFDGAAWTATDTLTAPNPTPTDRLGASLSANPTLLVGGAPGPFSDGVQPGSAVSFVRSGDTWLPTATTTGSSAITGARFGAAVAVDQSGSVLVVGAPNDNLDGPDAGGAFLFEGAGGGSWTETDRLRPRSTGAFDRVGTSVAFDDDIAVAGAPTADHSGLRDSGAVFVYERAGSTFSDPITLVASDAEAVARFGAAVATNDGRVVVGAWSAAEGRGRAYIFDSGPGGWEQSALLTAPDAAVGDGFGIGVAIDADRAAVAALGGARVYVFRADGDAWMLDDELSEQTPPDAGGDFAGAVDLDGDDLVLGYPNDPSGASVTTFTRTSGSWQLAQEIREPSATDGSFASAVAISGDLLAVGSPQDDGDVPGAGAVWVYRRVGSTWGSGGVLADPGGENGDRFGQSLAFVDGRLVVGAPQAAGGDGRVVVFADDGNALVAVESLSAPPSLQAGSFGNSVGGAGSTVIAGAPLGPSAEGAPEGGMALVFTRAEEPLADFRWSPDLVIAGSPVQFTDLSSGSPDSWQWTFGDGGTSDEVSPVYTYATAGVYQVTLTVSNSEGDSTFGQSLTVVEAGGQMPGFAWSPAFPEPGDDVSFTDRSTGPIDSWSWSFGDGGGSDEPSPVHSFPSPGEYAVELTVTGPGGAASVTRTVTVSDDPIFDADANIAAVARIEGAGAFFTSRVDLFNTSEQPVEVDLVYTPRQDLGGPGHRTVISLDAKVQLEVLDPLGEWFGIGDVTSAVGALRLAAIGGAPGDVLAQSVVIAQNDDDTEYGQFFPAFPTADALAAGETAFLSTTVDAARTRVNLGVMAVEDGTTVVVRPEDPVGTPLGGQRTFALDAGETSQLNDLDRRFALGGASDYVVRVDVTAGRALVYGSVLDGNSGTPGTSDPTTVLPVVAGADVVTLLELGPIVGFDEFSGSASVTNLGTMPVTVTADFHARGTPGVAVSQDIQVDAGDTLGYVDLVGDLFELTGVGTVVLTASPGSRLMATGREFSILRDTGGDIVGTAGQLIPGMEVSELLVVGSVYHLLGLRQIETGGGLERSHVAAFNPGTGTATVTLELYDGETGDLEGTFDLRVRGGELVQRNNIIRVITGVADGTVKRIEATADAPVYLKAFRVNKDGDPVTIDALAGSAGR